MTRDEWILFVIPISNLKRNELKRIDLHMKENRFKYNSIGQMNVFFFYIRIVIFFFSSLTETDRRIKYEKSIFVLVVRRLDRAGYHVK